MAHCVNRNTEEFKNLLKEIGGNPVSLGADIALWQEKNGVDNFPSKDELLINKNPNEIRSSIKAVSILQSDKAKQVFEKGLKNNWDLNKILTELAIPKEQKQLILDISKNIHNVWHASNEDIQMFVKENIDNYFVKTKGGSPKAVFFTANKAPQESFLSKREYQKQFSVKMENPMVVDYINDSHGMPTGKNREQLVQEALDKGYDGLIWKNIHDNGFVGDVYVSLNADNINSDLREQLALELASNYSYAIEINVAKEEKITRPKPINEEYDFEDTDSEAYNEFVFNGDSYSFHGLADYPVKNYERITEEEFDNAREQYLKKPTTPTQHYSNLTVPGGTNYTENEIATPAITPSIKGHAQFSTDKGIGWFRSDEQLTGFKNKEATPSRLFPLGFGGQEEVGGKTRRILEVQSDLFQKGRDRKDLISYKPEGSKEYVAEHFGGWAVYNSEIGVVESGFTTKEAAEKWLTPKDNKNDFLQLLNKDNNWVTFFVKSIVQDSAKKGYEKVLFPSGNTASKVEGHTTLEEFKKEKEDRIKKLEENKKTYDERNPIATKEHRQNKIDFYNNEINQLKQELERVEIEGFGALKPIFNFYENALRNILKNNFTVQNITDEYGNTWISIDLSDSKVHEKTDTILFNKDAKPQPVKTVETLATKLTEKDRFGKRYIQRINGSDTKLRILKDWKAKGKEIIRRLEVEYPGAMSSETINGEVIITINPQASFRFNKEESIVPIDGVVDTTISKRLFNGKNETTAVDVLTKISESNHPLASLAKKLIMYAKTNNIKISLEDVESFTEETDVVANGYYNAAKNEAKIAGKSKFNKDGVETVILHEILHSLTYHQLKMGTQAAKDFKILYEHALSTIDKDGEYGLHSIDEFIVALFTNPSFIRKAMGIKASPKVGKYTNFFKQIFDKILSMLNIGKSNSLYEQAFAVATNIIEEGHERRDAIGQSVENDPSILDPYGDEFNHDEIMASKAPVEQRPFERQYVFLSRKIKDKEKELKGLGITVSPQYKILKAELAEAKAELSEAAANEDRAEYVSMGQYHLDWVEDFIKNLPDTPDKYTMQNISNSLDILNAFSDLHETVGQATKLREQLMPYIFGHNIKTIQYFDTSGNIITEAIIDAQTTDIRWSSLSMGSLSDVANYIGSTIASVIKAAQNKVSTINKSAEKTIQDEVDKLTAYAKKSGTTIDKLYDLFIQENQKGSLQLTQRYDMKGELNLNYDTIFQTEELKNFYIFYQNTLKRAEANLPYKVGKFYMLNVAKSTLKSDLKRIIPVESVMLDSFVSSEDLLLDIVPEKFRTSIKAENKSRDLGSGLLQFVAYANNHNELSTALPECRLLQEQLKYRRTKGGSIEARSFVKSSDPTSKVEAKDSNIYKMVNAVIDMQLKEKMKDHKMKAIKLSNIPFLKMFMKTDIKDEDGNIIGYKQVHIEDVLDKMLRGNSLLRIGLSPVTAVANVLFGEVSNFIEAVGGRHFTIGEMSHAKKIFATQIDYISNKHDTNIYKWLHKLNPLQELADYELGENLTTNPKKLTADKAMEMMYAMQKKGELELQSTTMVAMLIHDGYMNSDGTNTPKGDSINEKDAIAMSNKIQRLNQMIHGRYSQREAATMQQSVWYRMAIQFRKWIPAAVEQRFGDQKWDNRLQVEVEGRYRTMGRKVFKAKSVAEAFQNMFIPLINSKKLLESGKMTETEIYNMRKNLTEMILLTATFLMAAGMKAGSDDDRKRKLKNPIIKAGLTMLNRVSGDMMFFYNPSNVSNLMKNAIPIGKLITDVINVGLTLPAAFYLGDYEIKEGSLKGYNKFWSKSLPKILPIAAPAAGLQRILNTKDVLPELN